MTLSVRFVLSVVKSVSVPCGDWDFSGQAWGLNLHNEPNKQARLTATKWLGLALAMNADL
jgi:hypothetical protein